MNKAKLQEKADAMQKDLDALKAEINKPEGTDIFKQKGVEYFVYDDNDRLEGVQKRKLHSFRNGGVFYGLLSDGDRGVEWQHHEIAYPQWIDIPDDLMEDPKIKGQFIIELKTGGILLVQEVNKLAWNINPMEGSRIKRICILEKQ
jgi:hypothetical protein